MQFAHVSARARIIELTEWWSSIDPSRSGKKQLRSPGSLQSGAPSLKSVKTRENNLRTFYTKGEEEEERRSQRR